MVERQLPLCSVIRSAIIFKDSTIRQIAAPGGKVTHQARGDDLALLSKLPHDLPRISSPLNPRNDKADSTTIASAPPIAKLINADRRELGKAWRNNTRALEKPSERAAVT